MASYIALSLLVITLGLAICLPFFLNWLADGDILYTKVREGTAKAVMRGKSLNHLVMSLKGSHLNDPEASWFDPSIPEWEVVKNEPGITCDSRKFLSRSLGLYFVGIPPFRSVYAYTFSWNEMRRNKSSGVEEVWPRDERTNFIYAVPFPYVILLSEAETDDRLPVDVEYLLTVRVVNPFKALFDTEDWMQVVTGAVNGVARNFVGHQNYDDLVSDIPKDGDATGHGKFFQLLKGLNDHLPDGSDGLHAKYGLVIEAADIQRVDIAGKHKDDILKATVAAYTADQEAYATKAAGEATADATRQVGFAEAEVTAKRGEAEAAVLRQKGLASADALKARTKVLVNAGSMGSVIAQTEAMASTGPGKTVIWANNPLMGAIPAVADALAGNGSAKPEADAAKEDA